MSTAHLMTPAGSAPAAASALAWHPTLADACLDVPAVADVLHQAQPLHRPLLQALARRQARLAASGLALHVTLAEVPVRADAPRLQALLLTLLDWAIPEAALALQLRVAPGAWPPVAALRLRFARRAPSASGLRQQAEAWQLVQRQAQRLGLALQRVDSASHCGVTLELPQVLRPMLGDLAGAAPGPLLQPTRGSAAGAEPGWRALAGQHVLTVSTRRELRAQVRELLQPLGVLVDGVADIDAAAAFCAEAPPQALAVEAALMAGLRARLRALYPSAPRPTLVQVDEAGTDLVWPASDAPLQLGRDALAWALPGVLLFGAPGLASP